MHPVSRFGWSSEQSTEDLERPPTPSFPETWLGQRRHGPILISRTASPLDADGPAFDPKDPLASGAKIYFDLLPFPAKLGRRIRSAAHPSLRLAMFV